eukprot:s899_g8.t2
MDPFQSALDGLKELKEHSRVINGNGSEPRFDLFHFDWSICSWKTRCVLMEKGIPWRSWLFSPGEHGNYQPAYVRLRSLGHPGGALVGEVFTGSTSAQSQGFDPLVVPTLVDRLKKKVVVDSKVICEYIEKEAHVELIKKHLALVDETPHMGMLYGLHLSDMVQQTPDPWGTLGRVAPAPFRQIKSVEAYLADSTLPPDLRPLYEAKKKKTELARSRVGTSRGTKEGYKEMVNKVATFLSELESDLQATGGPFICGAECTMADLVWHTSLLRLYELGFDDLFSEDWRSCPKCTSSPDESGLCQGHLSVALQAGDAQLATADVGEETSAGLCDESDVPLNMQRLKLALRHDVPIRFRQFQSTTSDYKVAARFQKREAR